MQGYKRMRQQHKGQVRSPYFNLSRLYLFSFSLKMEQLEVKHRTELSSLVRNEERELEQLRMTFEKDLDKLRQSHKTELEKRVSSGVQIVCKKLTFRLVQARS